MRAIKYCLFLFLIFLINSGNTQTLSPADLALVKRELKIPKTWTISKTASPWNTSSGDTYCTVFLSPDRKRWLGNFCVSSNEKVRFDMGVWDEVPDEEHWGDPSREDIGYWSVTPMFIYPMTPFILHPIKNYAAEVDCNLGDGRGYLPTSTCHTAYYQLREGVFIHSVFHIFDNVKRKQKVQVSDIRNLWIHISKKISKESRR
ncbi:hypothetical protein Hrubri_1167 [Herbaspirillum rubrisubalbicans M1]|uniref:hypothetical protein n=1 Tax=Herbaspirillum rubrisubalbicans TaxID=80842 RepID=UPI00073A37A6|nr:hypothetical protein [Herbaspirillum rubrisubalbicans]ALU88379.1 hypothetical protein Hrubri_1167 [Herbaspirillum rubrisubalbicans M1]